MNYDSKNNMSQLLTKLGSELLIVSVYPKYSVLSDQDLYLESVFPGVEKIKLRVDFEKTSFVPLLQELRLKPENRHKDILLLDYKVKTAHSLPEELDKILAQMKERSISWGAIAGSGVAYPYFKKMSSVLNLDPDAIPLKFSIPACDFEGHILLLNRDLTFELEEHIPYDIFGSFLCAYVWEKELVSYLTPLSYFYNTLEKKYFSEPGFAAIRKYFTNKYGNPELKLFYHTLGLEAPSIVAKDYYKKVIDPVLFKKIEKVTNSPSMTVFIRTLGKRISFLRRALYSLATQEEIPEKVVLIVSTLENQIVNEVRNVAEDFKTYFSCELLINPDSSPNSRVTSLNLYFSQLKSDGGYSFCLDDDDYLYPNFIYLFKQFYRLNLNDQTAVGVIDFYRMKSKEISIPTSTSEVSKIWYKYEKATYPMKDYGTDLLSQNGNFIPFCAVGFPNSFLARYRHLAKSSLIEDYRMLLALLELKEFFFFRKFGGEVCLRDSHDNVVNNSNSKFEFDMAYIDCLSELKKSQLPVTSLLHLNNLVYKYENKTKDHWIEFIKTQAKILLKDKPVLRKMTTRTYDFLIYLYRKFKKLKSMKQKLLSSVSV